MKIETVGYVNPDGSLDLHLATNLPESEVKVIILIDEPVPNEETRQALRDIEAQRGLKKLHSLDKLLSELP